MPKCPQCSIEYPSLTPVDADVRTRILKQDPYYPIFDQICRGCMADLRKKSMGGGGVLLAQERAREDRKKKLWQSRVSLVKNGHAMMANQQYSDAAVCYEKYLRLLEIVFECPAGQLSPEALKEAARTAELTVIAGVYWDLIRIYDTSDKYLERQKKAAKQLTKFLPYTPIFADLMKKAQAFLKQAKHPDVIKSFLASAKKKRTRCFVATSAFVLPHSMEVQLLRGYRDNTLKKTFLGRQFIYFYYLTSPHIACFLDKQEWLKPFVRLVLRFVIKCVS